jgi:hypothetical protein
MVQAYNADSPRTHLLCYVVTEIGNLDHCRTTETSHAAYLREKAIFRRRSAPSPLLLWRILRWMLCWISLRKT